VIYSIKNLLAEKEGTLQNVFSKEEKETKLQKKQGESKND